jgi:hypothetical protein
VSAATSTQKEESYTDLLCLSRVTVACSADKKKIFFVETAGFLPGG